MAFEQALAAAIDGGATDVAALQSQLDALSAAVKPPSLVGTAGSGQGFISTSTAYGRNVVHKVSVNYEAAVNGNPIRDATLWTLPAKTRVLRVVADVTQEFQGGSISAVLLSVGRLGTPNCYLLAQDVWTAPDVFGRQQGDLGTEVMGGSGFVEDIPDWSVSSAVLARFAATGADLNELTQGAATFYIECCTYP